MPDDKEQSSVSTTELLRILADELSYQLGRFSAQLSKHPLFQTSFWHDVKTSYQGQDETLKKHYDTFQIAYGSSFQKVKAAYRMMIKRYHPDKFQDADKKDAATELLKRLNESYAYLEKALNDK